MRNDVLSIPLRRLGEVVVVAVLLAGRAAAREYSPRVVSPHNADAYSMKTFAQFPRWRHLSGDARAWEVFRYLADPRTGLFPLGQPVVEGRDVLPEYRTVRDPVKIINVYGYGFYGILGPTMAGSCQDMGLGRSRTLILPGWHHVVAETCYDSKWHYLDLDVRAAFRRGDGSLASMADAQRDASLWQRQGPLFFPLDPVAEVQKVYEKTPVHAYYDYHSGGHTMDSVLRQGETFTRWWKPQGGRWLHAEHHQEPFFKALFERAPPGPKCKHQGWTVNTHGNGRFVYRPDLTDRSSDFADGVHDAANVRPGADGLTLCESGQGHAVFEVRTPYVIVPLVGKMETTADDREASVITLDASGVTLSISLDNGLTWQAVEVPRGSGGPVACDLTRHVAGSYGYLFKLALAGKPAEAVVRSLSVTTWVQVAPASLPSLGQGKNRMEYRTGDHHGLPTRVMEIRTNGSDRADFLKYLHEPPEDFDPERKTSRARGSFVVKVAAPPGSRVAWLSAGGSFHTHQGAAARTTRNAIAYAVDEPRGFRTIYRAEVPPDQGHWHYNVDREVRLDTPARVVYLRYAGDPGVNNLRIYAHCIDDRPSRSCGVTITHAWSENGVEKSKTVKLTGPGTYEVETAAAPVDESLELSVPSR
jgi:hypothetical protein